MIAKASIAQGRWGWLVPGKGKPAGMLVQIVLEESLNLLIQDEGQGFNLEEVRVSYSSTGLSAMRERVELVGGQLTIETKPGIGITIVAEIPIEPEIRD